MFEVKMLLRFIQSLFYPPQAVDVDGVDLLDDVSCLLKNLLVLLLVRRLGPLLQIRLQQGCLAGGRVRGE
jgi:hypothetical protein